MSNIIISNIGPAVNSQFNELRVARKFPIVELTSVYGLSDLRDVVTTTGSGTVSNNATEYVISTTSGGTDSAALESALRGWYEPGFAGEAGIGVRLPSLPIGTQIARWGLFDLENGAFFGVTSSNIFVAVRRGGVDTVINQSAWNVDPLNGSGPSGATLSLSKGNVYQVVFTWYGYGVIEFRVVIPDPTTLAQEVITVHRFAPFGQTSLIDPNQPLRAEISNNGTPDNFLNLFVGGRQYAIVGKYAPTFRVTSERRTVSNVSSTFTPLISFTRKAVFPAGSARANSVQVGLEEINIISGTDLAYQVLLNGTIDGTFINYPTATTNIPDSETALLVNNSSTSITGGEVVFQGVASGGGISKTLATAELLDFTLPINGIVTLAVASIGGGGTNTVSAVFRVVESW